MARPVSSFEAARILRDAVQARGPGVDGANADANTVRCYSGALASLLGPDDALLYDRDGERTRRVLASAAGRLSDVEVAVLISLRPRTVDAARAALESFRTPASAATAASAVAAAPLGRAATPPPDDAGMLAAVVLEL